MPGNSFEIRKTDQRVDDLVKRIESVLASGKICGRDAKGLRSRLSFACSQLYGRTAASVLKDLGRYECQKQSRKIDPAWWVGGWGPRYLEGAWTREGPKVVE